MKFRLFPTEKEKIELHKIFDQFRWYYNATVTCFNDYYEDNVLDQNRYVYNKVRDLIMKYEYTETLDGRLRFQEFKYNEDRKAFPLPEWWKGNVHNRVPRGAVFKFVSSLNSAISNLKNGNISNFDIKFRTKKSKTDYAFFEDKAFPAFINKIKSHFWYRSKDRKRKTMSFASIKDKKSLELIYEKETDRYFLHAAVEANYFPKDDLRNENQVAYEIPIKERLTSLDPGVRKFLVGYDPSGEVYSVGYNARNKLTNLLLGIDEKISHGKKVDKEYRYLKNLVSELHWKTINFLIKKYDIILLPEFRVKQMVKGRKMIKRLMNMFSFYQFKEKLAYKCEVYNKKLFIVDESYTSCTCTNCGTINKVEANEVYACEKCKLVIDRDINGARNILLKNMQRLCIN